MARSGRPSFIPGPPRLAGIIPRGVPRRTRSFERSGRRLGPPKMVYPIPPTDDPQLTAAYEEFRQIYPTGSLPEFIVFNWLVSKGFELGVDFTYQEVLLGGRTEFGGFVLDFYFPPPRAMVWEVNGIRFHLTEPRSRSRERVKRQIIESRGFRLIILWEDDILTRPDYTLEKALEGFQLPTYPEVTGYGNIG